MAEVSNINAARVVTFDLPGVHMVRRAILLFIRELALSSTFSKLGLYVMALFGSTDIVRG